MRWVGSLLLAAAVGLVLTACGSREPEQPDPGVELPPRFHATAADTGTVTPPWLASLLGPQCAHLVREALVANPTLQSAVARVARARASAERVSGERLPDISLGFDAQRQQSALFPTGSLPIDKPAPANSYRLEATVRWELDVWGRLSDRAAAAWYRAQAVAADRVGTRLSVAADTARAWIQVIAARRQRDLAQDVLTHWQDLVELQGQRLDRGTGDLLAVKQARLEREQARADLTRRERLWQGARRRLEVLLGRYPAGAVETVDELPHLPPLPAIPQPLELLRRRPDLVAAELRYQALGADLSAARKALLPGISLFVSGGYTSRELDDLISPEGLIWTILGSITQPIFQGGRLRAQVRVADAEQAEALADYARTVLQAVREVEDGLENERLLRQQLREQRATIDAAESTLELTSQRYERGLQEWDRVIDARRRLDLLQGRAIDLRQSLLDNRIALHLALAGDFLRPLPEDSDALSSSPATPPAAPSGAAP